MLPQLGSNLFLTDGGLETTLIFHEELELAHFAAFPLLKTEEGIEVLSRYYRSYAEIAKKHNTGFILETATWRANDDWAKLLEFSTDELNQLLRDSVKILEAIRDEYKNDISDLVISGCLGPRGDGYVADQAMTATEAEAYHRPQIETFSTTAADLICAITMNYVEEALGIAKAAQEIGIPVAISFTVETDGRLPTGSTLQEAIEKIDSLTASYPAYYMINCAHPTHFNKTLQTTDSWVSRIHGLRANASRMSHAELDEAPELDCGNPVELGQEYQALKSKLPKLNIMGGCCGTDHRHIEQIAVACSPLFNQ